MKTFAHRYTRWACLTVAGCLAWMTVPAATAEAANIVSIEELWELSIGKPTPDRSSPQTSMLMSPHEDLKSTYFMFTLNHKSFPNFSAGGMQVQEWDGDNVWHIQNGPQTGTMGHENETVNWSQILEIHDGLLTFEVLNGSSQSWNSFGGQGYLKLSTSTGLRNLNGYRLYNTLGESEVGYAGNRVQTLVLKKLIWVTDDNEVHELLAPIAIDTELDP
ncbi:MAG: hypothetical protein ABGX16_20580 [Pirellulales bacterium]